MPSAALPSLLGTNRASGPIATVMTHPFRRNGALDASCPAVWERVAARWISILNCGHFVSLVAALGPLRKCFSPAAT
jgi:hypothetical protein